MMKDGENLDKAVTISISKWREKYGKIIWIWSSFS